MPFIGAPSPTRYLDKVSDRTTHTADGVQKSFAVKYDENHVSVFKNGMKLIETVDYLVEPLGQYVTLIQTPLANDMIECVGTTEVTDLSKSSYYRESFKPSANDQTITLETNINNSFDLNVYYNGIRLTANDYTVSITANEITFIEPLREDDRIEVELFAPGYRVHRDTQSFRDLSDFDPAFEENQTLRVGSDGNFYFANTDLSAFTDIDSTNTEVGHVLTVKQDGTYNFQSSGVTGQIAAFVMPTAPEGWLVCDGSNNLSIVDFPLLYNVLCLRTTASTESGSNMLTVHSPISGLAVSSGWYIRGAGIPEGTNISVVLKSTEYVLSQPATETNSNIEIRLLPWGTGSDANSFRIPDLRGEFLRGWDNGRGVDNGRPLGHWQQDAIRNLTGRFGLLWIVSDSYNTGVFYNSNEGTSWYGDNIHSHRQKYVRMDASRQVPTAPDNRPRNISVLYCIKY